MEQIQIYTICSPKRAPRTYNYHYTLLPPRFDTMPNWTLLVGGVYELPEGYTLDRNRECYLSGIPTPSYVAIVRKDTGTVCYLADESTLTPDKPSSYHRPILVDPNADPCTFRLKELAREGALSLHKRGILAWYGWDREHKWWGEFLREYKRLEPPEDPGGFNGYDDEDEADED